MIEYIDFMMELINCFEAPAELGAKDEEFNMYKKRINLV